MMTTFFLSSLATGLDAMFLVWSVELQRVQESRRAESAQMSVKAAATDKETAQGRARDDNLSQGRVAKHQVRVYEHRAPHARKQTGPKNHDGTVIKCATSRHGLWFDGADHLTG